MVIIGLLPEHTALYEWQRLHCLLLGVFVAYTKTPLSNSTISEKLSRWDRRDTCKKQNNLQQNKITLVIHASTIFMIFGSTNKDTK